MLHDVQRRLPDLALTLPALAALACCAALCAAGCGGPSCDAPHCTYDPPPSVAMIQTCRNTQSSKCGGRYDDWLSCVSEKTACARTQTTDPSSRDAALLACQGKYDAYVACANAR